MHRDALTLFSAQRETIHRTSLVLAAALAFSASAAAQTKTWTGASANGAFWNFGDNWTPGSLQPALTDAVVFDATGAAAPTATLFTNGTAASITYNAGATNYTVTSNAGVSLSGPNAITVSANTTGTQTINLANIVSGSLLFPTGQNLTITNNATVTTPTLVIGPSTVIGTPGSGGVVVGGTGTTTFSGSFADSSGPNNRVVGGLTKTGTGTVTLSGNGANLSGGLNLGGGVVWLDFDSNTATKFTGPLISSGGDIRVYPHATTSVTQATTGTTLNAGHTSITLAVGGATPTVGLGVISRSAGATLDVPLGGPFTTQVSNGNTNGLLGSGPAFATINGSSWAAQSGGNAVAVTGTANNFSNGTNTNLTSNQSPGTFVNNSLRFTNSNVTLTLSAGNSFLASGGILVPTGVTGSVITGDELYADFGDREFLVHAYGPLTINAILRSSAGLTKTGPDALTLGGDNFLTGPITVNRGALRVTNINAVAPATGIFFTDTVARGDSSANLFLDMGVGVNATFNKPITYSAAAAGNGNVFKSGAGALTLGGTNTYGALQVAEGTLGITGSNTASRDVTLANGTLNIIGGGAVASALGFIGGSAGGNATANVGGGSGAATWTVSDELQVGDVGPGTLNITGGGGVTNGGIGSVGTYAGGSGTANVGGGVGAATWMSSGQLQIGSSGSGTLNITGGGAVTNSVGGFVGKFAGGVGTVNVGGGVGAATWNTPALTVGDAGAGTLNITGGGTVTNAGLAAVGAFAGSTGTVNVGGGIGAATWNHSGDLRVGSEGTGVLTITGGGAATNAAGTVTIGAFAGGVGTVNVGGGTGAATWTHSGELRVGSLGTGTLAISGGGAVTNTGSGSIGTFAGGVGTVNVGGGVGAAMWTNTFELRVGVQGTGTLNLLGGGVVSTPNLAGGNANSSVNFDGGTLRITATDTASNTINVLVRGGTIDLPAAGSTFFLPAVIAGTGTLTKTGPGTLIFNGTGTNFTGGVAVNAGRLDMFADAALGTATLGAGPLGTIRYLENATTARTFNLTGGTLEVPTGVTLGLGGATVAGGFLVGSGTITTQAATANTFVGNTTFTATNLTLGGTDSLTNFSNGGLITKSAGSTATLTRFTNTSSGRMDVTGSVSVSEFVSNGLIDIPVGGLVNNTASNFVLGGGSKTFVGTVANPGGSINLSGGSTIELSGGLLVNNGTINGTVNVNYGSLAKGSGVYGVVNVNQGGVYAPGNSPGISTAAAVTFDNSPVTSGAPTLIMELGGTALGTQYDQLHVTGLLSLGGTLAVSLIEGFTPAAGNSFDILDWGTLSGTFSTINLPTLSGLSWNTSQLYSTGVLSLVAAGLVGDYNGNDVIDAADYTVWRDALSAGGATDLLNDPTPGTVDESDFTYWRAHFGETLGSGAGINAATVAIPEPSSLVLALGACLGLTAAAGRRRRGKMRR